MRKLSKKISMLMVLAMLVGLFSGVVSASAASAWSFKSKNYNVAVDGTVVMGNKEYADFDLLKDGKAPTGYTVTWASSDENVVWVNAKTGQLRVNKLGMADIGDKAVISATFTNTATKKSATRSFVIAYGTPEYKLVAKIGDVVLGEETLAVGESYKLATTVLDEAGNSVDFKTCKLYRNYFIDGKEIANPYVPEKAGEVTITVAAFTAKADMKDLSKAVQTVEYKVIATTGAFAAEASSVYEFTATGKFAQDAAFTVVKNGTQKVAVKSVKVAENGASAVITLTNKLTDGIYTITCDEQTVDVDVDDEMAVEIKIYEDGDVVYTGDSTPNNGTSNKDLVYVHYDVFNQYGDSIRKSCTITWSSNVDEYENNKNLGILTLQNKSGADFRFSDLIVLNGVAMNNGKKPINVTANMKVSLDHAASKVEVIGVVKNNSNVLLQEVPANFVGGEYSLVFKMFDRDGFEMVYNNVQAEADFSFNSMDPLLISDIKDDTPADFGTVYIDGVAYGKLALQPGLQAKFGGYAEIKAISNKTGIESNYNLRVVSDQIVQEFTILEPESIVARNNVNGDATGIDLKYIALDEEGDEITDFRALYKAISFSSSDFKLVENNEGKAVLKYTVDVNAIKPEKSYDASAIVTTILYTVSGNSATKQINIKLDRIASETKEYTGDTNVLEGGSIEVKFPTSWNAGTLQFLDQYGDTIVGNKLFRSTKDVVAGAIDYAGGSLFEQRLVGVRVKKAPAGSYDLGGIFDITGTSVTAPGYTGSDYIFFDPFTTSNFFFNAGQSVTTAVEEYPVEFVLYDAIKKEFVGGSDLIVTFKVADLSQVVEFTVGVEDSYLEDNNDKAVKANNLKGKLRNGATVAVPTGCTATGTAIVNVDYVLRDYDFVDVGVPVLDDSNKLVNGAVTGVAFGAAGLPANNTIIDDSYVTNDLIYKDQSQRTPDGWFKDRKLAYDVTATVYSRGVGAGGSNQFRGTAKATIEYGDVERLYVKFGFDDNAATWITKHTEAYVNATNGVIKYSDLTKYINNVEDTYNDYMNGMWGGSFSPLGTIAITATVTKAVEGGKGLVEDGKLGTVNGMLAVENAELSAEDVMITGAEIGDTFVVTYTVAGHPVTHTINFTVGSDTTAWFSDYNTVCDYR